MDGRRAEPHLRLLELDVDGARAFGGSAADTGLAGVRPPRAGEVVLEEDAARALAAAPGDRIRAIAAGGAATLRVAGVVPGVGLAGLGDQADAESVNALVAPGTVAAIGTAPGGRPPEGLLLISNGGGVFAGAARTDEVASAVAGALAPVAGVTVQPVKRDLLDQADEAGASFTAVFGAIGAVAVIAGILLLVNVFVMLADERTTQLGTLRALGLKRLAMVRTFAMEGAVYAVAGAALGALAGVGVARVVVGIAAAIFEDIEGDLAVRLAVPPGSVLLGFAIGAGISLVTVWLTSARTARLNVIRAIRDLPAPPWRRSAGRIRAASVAALALGAVASVAGIGGGAWFAALVGPVLAIAGAAGLLATVVRPRPVVTAAAIASLAWGAACVVVLPDTFERAGVQGFVAQGVVMCAAGICLATLDSGLWMRAARLAPRGALPARLGLAYPIARPFRTAIQMGMFALVIFGLVFMSVITHLYGEQAPRYVAEIGAGHTVVVDSSPGNPVPAAALAARPGVTAVAPLLRALPEFSAPRHPEYGRWYMTGFDARLLARGTPALGRRAPGFATDRAAWQAVLRSRDLAIVPDWFLQVGGGTEAHYVEAGESIVMRDPATGRSRRLRVAGIVEADWANGGVMVAAATARAVLGADAVPSRAFAATAAGLDPDALAAGLTADLTDHGADAESLRAVVDRALGANRAFMALAQGFVALGLVIGVGGLGVVMVRAVRERRRQIGMLRAMGLPSRTVRRAFVLESGFVAARGLLIGGGLALLSCWLLATRSTAFGESSIPFSAPWGTIAAMLAAALAASLAATALPAARAARVRPAVALRVTE
jgi:putative ABC transport system permease protein